MKINKVNLDKFITGEGNDEYENQYTMDGYEQQYKESQDAVRKYAHDLKNVQKKLDLAVDIILALQKIINTGIPKSLHSEINLIPPKIQKQINALTKGGYRG